MKYIQLTQGKRALVDDEDYEYLSQWKWRYSDKGYAVRTGYSADNYRKAPHRKGSGNITIRMHSIICPAPGGMMTDHINMNRIDNRKENLRVASPAQNRMNGNAPSNNTSGHRGVMWHIRDKVWVAYIYKSGKRIQLGSTNNLGEAIHLRELAVKRYFGEFARE